MNSQIKDQELYENIEFQADFQLFLGNIFRMNGALLEISENICSKDSLITVLDLDDALFGNDVISKYTCFQK